MKRGKVRWGLVHTSENTNKDELHFLNHSIHSEVYACVNQSERSNRYTHTLQTPKHDKIFLDFLMDPMIDVIYLPSITDHDIELFLSTNSTKKHILFKNISELSVQRAQKLIHYCEKNQLFLVDATYHSIITSIKTQIDEAAIGSIKLIRASFLKNHCRTDDHSTMNAHSQSAALRLLSSNCIKTIHYLIGNEPIQVVATGTRNTDASDTTLLALLDYPNHVQAVIDCSIGLHTQHRYEIIGSKGAFTLSMNDEVQNSAIEGIKHMNDCIHQHGNPLFSKEHTLNNLKVVESLFKSKNQKSIISLNNTQNKSYRWGEECGIAALLQR